MKKLSKIEIEGKFTELFGEEGMALCKSFEKYGEWVDLRSGKFLFQKDEKASRVNLILDGVARLHSKANENGSLIIRFLRKGDIAGIVEALQSLPFQYNAKVHSDHLFAYSIKSSDFLNLLQDFPNFAMHVMRQVDKDASFIEMRLADIRSQRVSDRIEGMVTVMQNKFGLDSEGHIDLDITPGNIAEMIGATRTTVYRSLKQLEAEGVMLMENHRIRPLRQRAI